MPDELRVDVGGVTLSSRVWPAVRAAGPAVVLLPGTGATAADWDEIAARLSVERPVFAVDLRGHGRSDWPGTYSIQLLADDVEALLAHLGHGSVDLVGHSLGGLVACKVAVRAPSLVRRLVLEDVGILHPRPAAPPTRPQAPLDFDWAVVEQVRPEIDDPEPSWVETIAAIQCPTLVIGGGPRSLVPQDHITELVERLPDGRLVTIDAGHLVHQSRPDDFVREVLAFIDPSLAEGRAGQ